MWLSWPLCPPGSAVDACCKACFPEVEQPGGDCSRQAPGLLICSLEVGCLRSLLRECVGENALWGCVIQCCWSTCCQCKLHVNGTSGPLWFVLASARPQEFTAGQTPLQTQVCKGGVTKIRVIWKGKQSECADVTEMRDIWKGKQSEV